MPPRALQSGSDRRRVQAASSATVAPLRVATGKGCQPHAAAGSLIAVALLLYAPSAHAAASPPIPPAVERISAQPPSTIELPLPAAPVGPSTRRGLEPSSPQIDSGLRPEAPSFARGGAQVGRVENPALLKELAQLRRAAEPPSGFGSTVAAANAAWTLGLIELHGGIAQRSPAQAQTWFERAARLGRQPLAYAGLAWCHIEGCKGPPDPTAAKQDIANLRPRHRARALYLEWMLNNRLQPLSVRTNDPQGVTSMELPMRDLLVSAANEGDAQARIELGLEAVTNGDLPAAKSYFQSASARSRAAAANLQLLDTPASTQVRQAAAEPAEAERLLQQAQRQHRGIGVPVNYIEALRLYQAAAAKGNAAAKRMLALIMSRPMPDGSVNIAWMSQLAYLDTANSLPQLDTRAMASMMYRDPTPLFDLLPEAWQRQLTTVPR